MATTGGARFPSIRWQELDCGQYNRDIAQFLYHVRGSLHGSRQTPLAVSHLRAPTMQRLTVSTLSAIWSSQRDLNTRDVSPSAGSPWVRNSGISVGPLEIATIYTVLTPRITARPCRSSTRMPTAGIDTTINIAATGKPASKRLRFEPGNIRSDVSLRGANATLPQSVGPNRCSFSERHDSSLYTAWRILLKTRMRAHLAAHRAVHTRNDRALSALRVGPITLDITSVEYYEPCHTLGRFHRATGVAWAGTGDDGLIHVPTRRHSWHQRHDPRTCPMEHGEHHEPSPHEAGSCVCRDRPAQARRSQSRSSNRTHDGGKTWNAAIVSGIPDGAYGVRCREIPRKRDCCMRD